MLNSLFILVRNWSKAQEDPFIAEGPGVGCRETEDPKTMFGQTSETSMLIDKIDA